MSKKAAFLLAIVLLALVAGGVALGRAVPTAAQAGSSYNLSWHVIGGGGQPLASASYIVHSTAGQGSASPPYATGSNYVVSGGYWFRWTYRLYLPLVPKGF